VTKIQEHGTATTATLKKLEAVEQAMSWSNVMKQVSFEV